MNASLLTGLLMVLLCLPIEAQTLNQEDASSRAQRAIDINTANARLPQPTDAPEMIAEDLQSIVILCATGQYTAELDKAWRAYVKSHYEPGTDIDRILEDISRRAYAWQTAMYKERPKNSSQRSGTLSAIMKNLHDTAKAVIQNMR